MKETELCLKQIQTSFSEVKQDFSRKETEVSQAKDKIKTYANEKVSLLLVNKLEKFIKRCRSVEQAQQWAVEVSLSACRRD